jgi:hypothetical protein
LSRRTRRSRDHRCEHVVVERVAREARELFGAVGQHLSEAASLAGIERDERLVFG